MPAVPFRSSKKGGLMTSEDHEATYSIRRIPGEIELGGDPGREPWSWLAPAMIDRFPWYVLGEKQATTVKACYTERCLYLQFECEDRHISASRTELNGGVCQDSCAEFFATVPEDPESYFNLEVNCCGTLHLGHGKGRQERRLIGPELAARITLAHSVPGPTKEESPADDGWVLEVGLPFDVLGEFIGRAVSVGPGTKWRGNFYRCGGATDPQHSCWSPVGTPSPDFHRPEYFGRLEFTA